MSPVWKPSVDPPCLDRFCYLSHDAQRVMLAMFNDYNERKTELLQIETASQTPLDDSRNYYRSIYEARFGGANSSLLPEGHYKVHESISHSAAPDHDVRTRNHESSGAFIDGHNQERQQNYCCVQHSTDRSGIEEHIYETATLDSSRYSDSPPIETQGYRILSQMNRLDAESESSTYDAGSGRRCSNGKRERPHWSNTEQTTQQEITDSINNNTTEAVNCNTKYGETEVHTDVTFTTSQSLFSQDNSDMLNITPNKRRAYSRSKNVMSKKYKLHNIQKGSKDEIKDTCNDSTTSVLPGDKTNDTCVGKQTSSLDEGNILESDVGKSIAYEVVNAQDNNNSVRKELDDDAINNNHMENSPKHTDSDMSGVEASIHSLNFEEENPLAGHCENPEREDCSVEVSSAPNNRSEKLYDMFKPPLEQKKVQHIQSKSGCQADRSGLSKKRQSSSSKGFTVPVKKIKPDNYQTDVKEVTKSSSSVIDVLTLSTEHQEQLIKRLLGSSEVIISLVYESGATLLRGSLFAQDSKKRSVGKQKPNKIRGFAVASKFVPDTVALFPIVDTDNLFHQTCRQFMIKLLTSGARKVGIHAKEIFLEILKGFHFDYSKDNDVPDECSTMLHFIRVCTVCKVDTTWTILDPLVALWLLDPDHPVSSFEQVLTETGMPQMSPSESGVAQLYEDMMLLSVTMERLYQQLQNKELLDLFICVESKLIPLLAALELTSLTVATHTLLRFSEILKKKCMKLEKEAHSVAGHAFLLTSPSQLRQVLFEELRLDTKLPSKSRLAKTSVNNQTSTSESVLTQLSPYHPLPGIILEYRQVQKLKSTYIDGILTCVVNDHLTTNWDQVAAATGRVTSYQPNIQAIPKVPVTITGYKENYIVGQEKDESIDIYARDAFISQNGWTLLAADFQQIELRLLAHLADDPVLLKLFTDKNTPDIFNALTAQWLGKSVDDITTVEREQTKRVVYSVMYGVGKEKLAEHLKMTVDQAKAIMGSFLAKFPAVSQFTKTCISFCQKHGYTCSIFKRRRLIPNIRHPSPVLRAQAERQAVNFCVQGSAADICKAAMLQVVHVLYGKPELKARLLVQIHDELLLEVADEDLQQVTGLVKEVMESSEKLCGSTVILRVPIPVTLSSGKTWGHMKPVDLTEANISSSLQ